MAKKLDWSRTKKPYKQYLSDRVWKKVQDDARAAITAHSRPKNRPGPLAPAIVQLRCCKLPATCGARSCPENATVFARKLDENGRFIRQIELCGLHAAVVAKRDRAAGLKIIDQRSKTRTAKMFRNSRDG